jgi:hypothetical protein
MTFFSFAIPAESLNRVLGDEMELVLSSEKLFPIINDIGQEVDIELFSQRMS